MPRPRGSAASVMFENLASDLPPYLRSIGIEVAEGQIPHLNRSEGRAAYRDYYDAETIELVARVYSYEIERFGYECGR